MQYSQEHLKTMVYAEFGAQTECIMGNWKIENTQQPCPQGAFPWLWRYTQVPSTNYAPFALAQLGSKRGNGR